MQIYFGRHKKKGEGETSVHSCTRMSENFRFGYPIYESCHMAKNIRVGVVVRGEN